MAAQVPAGLLVDAMAKKTQAAAAAIVAIIAGALTIAYLPTLLPILAAEISHAFASCMLGPAIAAITLGLAGARTGAIGERLGRNARFASIGNGAAAGLMAVVGDAFGARSVFVLGAALAVPGLGALRLIAQTAAPLAATATARITTFPSALLKDRRLIWFAACCLAFHLSNAAMLPLAAAAAAPELGNQATLVIGACIVGPQIVVALFSPFVGRSAERFGRRRVLAMGMLALPARGLILALMAGHAGAFGWPLVSVQLLDGVSAAAFGVLMPLVASDIAAKAGRFNLCMGLLGLAIGAGAAASTLLGGLAADRSLPLAFVCLAGVGALGAVLAAAMPETQEKRGLLF